MEVRIGILGHVVVKHNIDSLNVHTSAKKIGGNQDTLWKWTRIILSCQHELEFQVVKIKVLSELNSLVSRNHNQT